MFRVACVASLALLCTVNLSAGEVSYRREVMPVLARAGCNMGACHGNLNGKGGLKLSLRGEEPSRDHTTLTREMLGRRVDLFRPKESLLLLKATGSVPHEGGIRFSTSSTEYQILHDWIAQGCRDDNALSPKLTGLTVAPLDSVLIDPVDHVRLTAQAIFANGTSQDVLPLVATEVNNVGVARVEGDGTIRRVGSGEAVVLVRYLDQQIAVRVAFIPNRPKLDRTVWPTSHPIDQAVWNRLVKLRIEPSALCTDGEFIRRLSLDLRGTLPSPAEVKAFLDDTQPGKRERLIDDYLASPDYALNWAQKWGDLLRNEEKALDRKGVHIFQQWLKGMFAEDRPLTELAHAVITGRGSTYTNPAANFYRAVRDPYQRAESVAQVFLGLRVSCARCHNHPFDVWTQDDYHRFSGVFSRIDYRIVSNDRRDMLDKHEFVGEQIVYSTPTGELVHPRGGKALPKLLGAAEISTGDDRLGVLADWVVAVKNPYFAQAQVNRIWMQLFGRGLVEPNDDFRATNPPTNPELLQHLVNEFQSGGARLKPFIKHITMSRTYQLSSLSNESNKTDETQFSHAQMRPLSAEQLLDAISRTLQAPVKFPGYPAGMRALELPALGQAGSRRATPAQAQRFLKIFGKPERLLTCECERSTETGALQSFQLITGELLNDLLREPSNRLGKFEKGSTSDHLDELYLAALARKPTDPERIKLLKIVTAQGDQASTRKAWEDIAWALINSKEFLLRR